MTDQVMSVNDVLSVLGQMELDLTQLIAQKRGILRIREVLTTYQAVSAELATMQRTKDDLAKEMQALQEDYDGRRTAEKKSLQHEKDHCAKECADAKAEMAEAKKKLKVVKDDLAEKERFAADRAAQLDSDLKQKSAELAKVTASFEAFKKQHGLAV